MKTPRIKVKLHGLTGEECRHCGYWVSEEVENEASEKFPVCYACRKDYYEVTEDVGIKLLEQLFASMTTTSTATFPLTSYQ